MAKAAQTIQSMTGFGAADGQLSNGAAFSWTLRSVNGRGLDLKMRLPTLAEPLEQSLRERLGKALARGSVSVNLSLRDAADEAPQLTLNRDVLAAVIAASEAIRAEVGGEPPSTEALLAVRGVLETASTTPDPEEDEQRRQALSDAFDEALQGLVASRCSEGAALGETLSGLLSDIDTATGEADALPSRSPEAIAIRLKKSVAELLETDQALDPDRLHHEAVLLASKADIREEVDRLFAHVEAARDLLGKGGAVGRDLNFLAQEFNREANTICSKSGDIALTRIGLRLKGTIDQLREQVQNIA
ncbi:MAG: YicC/YloC family endoribonuclease [Pseudomonadota bacterium]